MIPILLQDVYARIIAHARQEAPYECCGLLAGSHDQITEIYPIRNLPSEDPRIADLKIPADRRLRYLMDPQEQFDAIRKMRQRKVTLMGIYHSHPHSPAYPSETDVRLAFYPDLFYFIVSLEKKEPVLRAFRIVDRVITEETPRVTGASAPDTLPIPPP